MGAWIETTAFGLLHLGQMCQIRIGPTMSTIAPAQLEVYSGPTEFIVLAQGTQAIIAGHYAWLRGLIAAGTSGVFTRAGL